MNRWAPWLLAAGIALVSTLHTVAGRFVWEDRDLVVENRYIRSARALAFVFHPDYWRLYHISPGRAYKPIAMATFALDYVLWGLHPAGFHLVNVAIHTANVLLVVALARGLTRSALAGLLAGLLFACHPIHAEAVAWVKNRAELVASALILLSCLWFSRWSRQGKRLAYLGAFASFLLALGAKGTAVVVAPLATLVAFLDDLVCTRPIRWRHTVPFWVVGCAFLVFRVAVLEPRRVPNPPHAERRPSVAATVAEYVRLAVFPIGLSADRGLPRGPQAFYNAIAATGLSALAILTFAARRKRARWAWGILWFLFALAPAANLRPIYGRPIAEQRLYLPSVGVCALIAALATHSARGELRPRRRDIQYRLAAGIVLVAVFCAACVRYCFVFHNEQALWTSVVRASPGRVRPLRGLAEYYAARGRFARAKRLFTRALHIDPDHLAARNGFGVALMLQGEWRKAAEQFRRILKRDHDYVPAHTNLSMCMLELGDVPLAQQEARAALKLHSDNMRAHFALGRAYELGGQSRLAIAELRQSIGLNPEQDAKTFCRIAELLLNAGHRQEAERYYRAALKKMPGWPPPLRALDRLAEKPCNRD